MPRSFVSRVVPSGTLLVAAGLIAVVSCEQVDVTTVDAARVVLSPPSAALAVAQTTQLTATVLSGQGQPLSGRSIEWRSLTTAVASVDNTGMVRGVSPGVATIRAASGNASGTAAATITALPPIALAPTEVTFTAVQSGATPGDRTISVTHTGTGTLPGLSVGVRYAPGAPTGWLTPRLARTIAPTTLALSANQGSIALGTYTAIVDVSAPTGSTAVTVQLIVVAPPPAIALGLTSLTFNASQGGGNPAQRAVGITNAGGGTLSGLTRAIDYATGQGWLVANFTATTAPATLNVRPTTGALAQGTYSATVRVMSQVAQNSPQSISVTFNVGVAQPAIALSPSTLAFSATRGGANPAAQTVQVSNAAGATLTGLATSVTYPGAQPAGWLSTQLSTTTAPATITVGVTTGALPNGTYTATLGVTSPIATNSPQLVQVSFQVLEPAPGTPSNLAATAISAAQINLSWTAASGVVTRYRIERKTGAAGTYAVIDSVAGNITTYQNSSGLTPTTQYFYRLRACNTTGCSNYSAEASATTAPAGSTGLSATTISSTQINLSWTATSHAGELGVADLDLGVVVIPIAAGESRLANACECPPIEFRAG